ncbi:MAG: lipid-A-disaccharide synthase, partial [Candidatus Obscuribacterales bacterium]|nr:lipid-A-disaccharide synthase [Candidatus Obscuribacterales bacterium]
HAAKLVSKLKQADPSLDIWGNGGSAMKAAGARLLYDVESFAVIGLIEPIKHLPKLIKIRYDLLNRIINDKPDAMLLMDFGGFNVGFATLVRKHVKTVPIVYFISPQVWGSRPWRINAILKAVTKMLVIFPFEEPLYRKNGVNARFVGHPVTQKFKPENERRSKVDFCKLHDLDPDKPIVGVFPGSRRQEIASHSGVVLEAISWLHAERPEIQFAISATNEVLGESLDSKIKKYGLESLVGSTIRICSSDHNEELMTHSDLLWAKSGSTTLEATLIAKPMLIFYHANWITYVLASIFKIVKYFGWPNLLHGEGIVPELIQLDCRAEQLVRYTRDWLDVPGLRNEITAELRVLKGHLGEGDFTDNAASEILSVLNLSNENAQPV